MAWGAARTWAWNTDSNAWKPSSRGPHSYPWKHISALPSERAQMGACHLLRRTGREIQSQMGKQHTDQPRWLGESWTQSPFLAPGWLHGGSYQKVLLPRFLLMLCQMHTRDGDNGGAPAATSPAGSELRPRPCKRGAVDSVGLRGS